MLPPLNGGRVSSPAVSLVPEGLFQTTQLNNNMGYSIYIGNAKPVLDEANLYAAYRVEHTERDDAPYWPNPPHDKNDPSTWGGDISEKTNGRHPSYSVFAEWAREVGLYELFLGDGRYGGLLHPHPGCQRLTAEIVAQVEAARINWEKDHPNAKPGWHATDDSSLAKLIWYETWMRWAMANCRIPAISNS